MLNFSHLYWENVTSIFQSCYIFFH